MHAIGLLAAVLVGMAACVPAYVVHLRQLIEHTSVFTDSEYKWHMSDNKVAMPLLSNTAKNIPTLVCMLILPTIWILWHTPDLIAVTFAVHLFRWTHLILLC